MFSKVVCWRCVNKWENVLSKVWKQILLFENCDVKPVRQSTIMINCCNTLYFQVRLRVGMYSVYLKDWLSVFPKSQFLILRLEDYSEDQTSYLRQIYSFLGQSKLCKVLKFNPFQLADIIKLICSRQCLKILWKKEKLLIINNFFFCHKVFNSIQLRAIMTKTKCFQSHLLQICCWLERI